MAIISQITDYKKYTGYEAVKSNLFETIETSNSTHTGTLSYIKDVSYSVSTKYSQITMISGSSIITEISTTKPETTAVSVYPYKTITSSSVSSNTYQTNYTTTASYNSVIAKMAEITQYNTLSVRNAHYVSNTYFTTIDGGNSDEVGEETVSEYAYRASASLKISISNTDSNIVSSKASISGSFYFKDRYKTGATPTTQLSVSQNVYELNSIFLNASNALNYQVSNVSNNVMNTSFNMSLGGFRGYPEFDITYYPDYKSKYSSRTEAKSTSSSIIYYINYASSTTSYSAKTILITKTTSNSYLIKRTTSYVVPPEFASLI